MVIVSGQIHVDPEERDRYLDGCREVVHLARAAPGCLDFHLSADPVAAGRINVYEQWASADDVEAFRGSGPAGGDLPAIRDAAVYQHDVAASRRL